MATANSSMALAPGRLFYVVGASGAGKDSVIAGCRDRIKSHHYCLVSHRYITRPPASEGENHIWLSHEEFRQRAEIGGFAMHWQANSHLYGISVEVNHWLRAGYNVVVNGSRGYLDSAVSLYGDQLVPVHIQVSLDVLRQRLVDRGREDITAIDARMQRAKALNKFAASEGYSIQNDHKVEDAVNRLMTLLSEHAPCKSSMSE